MPRQRCCQQSPGSSPGGDLPFADLLKIQEPTLGSDVPFFLTGGTAIEIGRGTELYGIPDIAEEPVLVVFSGTHVATGPAYQALGRSLTFTKSSSSINNFQAFVQALESGRSAGVASALSRNDFEAVVFKQHPKLRLIAGRMRDVGVTGTRMTGKTDRRYSPCLKPWRRESAHKRC